MRIPAGPAGLGGAQRGPLRASPQDVVLRGMMQALVRMQAYLLADIVVAIPRVDLAVEALVWGGCGAVCPAFADPLNLAPLYPCNTLLVSSAPVCSFQSESCDIVRMYTPSDGDRRRSFILRSFSL